MDQGLLLISTFLRNTVPEESRSWAKTGMERLDAGFTRDFTPEMVHRENIPAYHLWAMRFFKSVMPLVAFHDPEIATRFDGKIKAADSYIEAVLKPNHALPSISDTHWARFVNVKPRIKSVVFPEAGTAIFCFERRNKPEDSTWMHFRSGYSTHVHKHADDLSFLLYTHGKDIFIDASFTNYNHSPETDAMRHATAHNTIVVDDQTYPLKYVKISGKSSSKRSLLKDSGLSHSSLSEACDSATGFNRAYKGVNIQRTVVYLKPDIIILHDIARSKEGHKYSQLFLVGQEMKIVSFGKQGCVLTDESSSLTVKMVQMFPIDDAEIYEGDDKTHRGFHSPSFDKVEPARQLAFSATGNKREFLTVITINRPMPAIDEIMRSMKAQKEDGEDVGPAKAQLPNRTPK